MFPAGLKKQLTDVLHEGFVVNRNVFEKCLVLYPMKEWGVIRKQLARLNRFVRKNEQFVRRFHNGATLVELDGTGRILMPKTLLEYAGIKKAIKVCGNGERIEIWDKDAYGKVMSADVDFADLAEEVMGALGNDVDDVS